MTDGEFQDDLLTVLEACGRYVCLLDPLYPTLTFDTFMVDNGQIRRIVIPWIAKKYYKGVNPWWSSKVTKDTPFLEWQHLLLSDTKAYTV